MSRSLQVDNYIVTSFLGNQSATFIVRAIEPNILISPLSDLDKQYPLYEIPVKWMIQGMPPLKEISFVARENMPQVAFTNVPEIDTRILTEIDDERLKNVCQTNRYVSNLCLDDVFWKGRVEKYYPDRAKDKDKHNLFNFTWRDYYRYLTVCNTGFYISYYIHTDTIRHSEIGSAYQNFDEAIDDIIDDVEGSLESSIERGEYGDKSKEEVEREVRLQLISEKRIKLADINGFEHLKVTPQTNFPDQPSEEIPTVVFEIGTEAGVQSLNDQDLKAICEHNEYARSLCVNDDFWRRRIEKYFPSRVNQKDDIERAYLFFDFTWQDYYKYLTFFGGSIYTNVYIDKGYGIHASAFQNKGDATESAQRDVSELIRNGRPLDPNSSLEDADYDASAYVEFADGSVYMLGWASINPIRT